VDNDESKGLSIR